MAAIMESQVQTRSRGFLFRDGIGILRMIGGRDAEAAEQIQGEPQAGFNKLVVPPGLCRQVCTNPAGAGADVDAGDRLRLQEQATSEAYRYFQSKSFCMQPLQVLFQDMWTSSFSDPAEGKHRC